MKFHRNIVENYPASRLPDDLGSNFDPDARVRVMIEDEVEILPGMLVIERRFDFKNGVVLQVSERAYTAS